VETKIIDFGSGHMRAHPFEKERPVPKEKPGSHFVGAGDLQTLKRACEDFESIFVYTLLKTMRASLSGSEASGVNREVYATIGDFEFARTIAYGRGIGLGESLFEQLRQKDLKSTPLG
jgi:flagellar protein FlgJ